jgi:RNA polymerase sigma factor for flagellar operon FliA
MIVLNQDNSELTASMVPGETREKLATPALRAYHQVCLKKLSEDEIVAKYAPLALKMVHRIAPLTDSIVDFDDLKNVAFFALVQCIRSFDPEIGVAFEVYCRARVRGAILDEIRKNYSVSRTVYGKWKALQEKLQDLTEHLSRQPTEAEIAENLGVSTDQYRNLLDELRPVAFVSLDSISGESELDDGAPFQLEDLTQSDPSDQTGTRDLQSVIRSRLGEMPAQQRKILTLYYYEDLRFKDIAALMGLTESRICQIHTEAILALRGFLDRQERLTQ